MPIESLYVHVPFCAGKCDYCAFYSEAGAAPGRRLAFLERLEAEFAAQAPRCGPLQTVFLGGGTPTWLPAAELARLLGAIRRNFKLAPTVEWTSEANPETLTDELAGLLAAGGVNRVSLGVQSFQPGLRRTLGRAGDAAAVERAVDSLRRRGLANLGLDLIYAIPGQTPTAWENDLCRAVGLGVQHLSTYALTIEEGSRLAKAGLGVEDDGVDLWEIAETVLAAAGLRRYEVSNFARPGFACRHNLDIWHGATYLGCGPSAASFDGQLRWTNPATLDAWLAGQPPLLDELPADQRAAEILAFGMRTVDGWRQSQFQAATGFDLLELRGPQLVRLAELGLVKMTADGCRPTRRGLLFADTIAVELL